MGGSRGRRVHMGERCEDSQARYIEAGNCSRKGTIGVIGNSQTPSVAGLKSHTSK